MSTDNKGETFYNQIQPAIASRNSLTDIWKVPKCCDNCPFVDNGKSIHLRDGRVDDIKKTLHEADNAFICHKTLESTRKVCHGAYLYMKEHNLSCKQFKLHEAIFGQEP